jgi:hypothetical protein
MKTSARSLLFALVMVAAAAVAHAAPVSTAFTYQGQLKKNGGPYIGTADLTFRLYDDSTGTTQVGSTLTTNGVNVDMGLFTVDLNFGPVFTGTALWMAISVSTPGDGAPTALAPRVPLRGVPFAQYALGSPGGGASQWTTGASGIHNLGHVGVGTAATSQHVLRVDSGNSNANTAFFSSSNATYASLFVRNSAPGGYGFFDDTSERHYLYGNLGFGTVTPGMRIDAVATNAAGRFDGTGNFNIPVPGEGVRSALFVHGRTGTGFGGAACGGIYSSSTDARAVSGWSNTNWGVDGNCTQSGCYGVLGTPGEGVFGYSPNTALPAGKFLCPSGGVAIEAQGLVKVKTLQILGGADLAEPFDVAAARDASAEPGTVVVIDEARPGDLRVSDRAYDTRVAGVISGANDLAPGMVMKAEHSEDADGAHPVALTGRVWCKVDASFGSVKPGDLLTTSPTHGHAMKANDAGRRAGAVIGKAMTSLEDGRGLVLVLVNLQ